MFMIISFFLIFLLLYVLVIYGLVRNFCPVSKYKSCPKELSASVIIPAKNEEKNIALLISKLKLQDNEQQVIIIDDYSNDGTLNTAEELISSAGNSHVWGSELPPGKKNALTSGIKSSSGDIILLTDADCIPEEKWISSFLDKFCEGYDLLFGIAPYIIGKSLVSKVSAFENMRGFILSLAALAFNMPYSAAARSLGFRRSSFIKIGGYENTMEVPFGDDGLLIREAVRHRLRIGAVTTEGSFVYTHPKKTFSEYFRQRKRHTRTSFYYTPKVKSILAVWHIINLIPLIAFFLFPLSVIYIFPLILKLFADTIIILSFQKKFGYNFRVYEIFCLQILYEIFIVFNFFNALSGNIKWK